VCLVEKNKQIKKRKEAKYENNMKKIKVCVKCNVLIKNNNKKDINSDYEVKTEYFFFLKICVKRNVLIKN